VTSSSWSDDDSDSNDTAMTSYRDVTASRQAAQAQSSSGVDEPPSSPVSATSPVDLVELFDVYYVLPPSPGRRGLPPPPPASRWTGRRAWDGHELTSTERRRPTTKCLLDVVPPTPVCCNERRAATLPASLVSDWSSQPPPGFVSIEIRPCT